MAFNIHTVEIVDNSDIQNKDRIVAGVKLSVSNAAGSGAGNPVTTTITLPSTANLPSNYSVLVNPGQKCAWHIPDNSKTNNSFDVVLTPADIDTLAAGTFDVFIMG